MTEVWPETFIPLDVSSQTHHHLRETSKNPTMLTVWKKSWLFNCDGFTVYDSNGNLVFRVDNYVARGNREIVLMDSTGRSLYTIHRKRLILGDNFVVSNGESTPFSVTKHVNVLNRKALAYASEVRSSNKRNIMYEIQGSYYHKSCVVYDGMKRRVAEIKCKEAKNGVALSRDVFSLVVQPLIDPAIAMALVIVLDQMFDNSRHIFVGSRCSRRNIRRHG